MPDMTLKRIAALQAELSAASDNTRAVFCVVTALRHAGPAMKYLTRASERIAQECRAYLLAGQYDAAANQELLEQLENCSEYDCDNSHYRAFYTRDALVFLCEALCQLGDPGNVEIAKGMARTSLSVAAMYEAEDWDLDLQEEALRHPEHCQFPISESHNWVSAVDAEYLSIFEALCEDTIAEWPPK